VVLAASSVVPLPAVAGPGDGSLTVKVIRDVNANGTYEATLESGVAGSAVLVTVGTLQATETNELIPFTKMK
jgi:hypothetical protein